MVNKDLGMVTAYAYAVSKGYTGTEEEFAALMADYAAVGQRAEAAATAAAASATAASGSASDSAASATAAEGFAENASASAGNASQAAQNASQSATAASGSATSAAGSATAAAGSATTAGNKATEAAGSATAAAGSATTAGASATAAQSAQTAAEAAQTAAETAQGAAEDAAESVSASVAQIDQNTEDISLVKSQIDAKIMVENINFADRIASPARDIAYSDTGIKITKIESLVPYSTGKFIASAGSDSWVFCTPYDNFAFGINKTSSTAYRLGKIPIGEVGETLDIKETLTPTVSGDYNTYTLSQPRGTIILFTKLKNASYPENLLTTVQNDFKMDGLVLNDIQDTFARYSVRDGMSAYTPLMVKLPGQLINTTTGGVSANANYDTYYLYCPVSSMTVKATKAIRCVVTSKAPDEITGTGSLIELKYSSAADRVESFTVTLCQYVAYSISTNADIGFSSDYVKTFRLPSLRLEYGQMKQAFYKFEKAGNNTYLRIYYPSGDKIVRWSLQNTPAAVINSNTWQLGPVYGYDFDGSEVSNGVELVTGGEYELAFREYGSADYCGGINHGDENTNDFTLLIDGKIINIATVDTEYHGFDRIVAIEHATVNRCDTPTEDILLHQKIWTFENGTVKVWQTLKFLEDLTCDFLCAMLPANRSAFTLGVRQGNTETEVMTSADFSIVTTNGNKQLYEMYGANASARFTVDLCEHTPVASMYVNNAPTMNKIYVEYFGTLTNQQEVTSGTVYQWGQEYDIAYN